jgi:hypothetical protein
MKTPQKVALGVLVALLIAVAISSLRWPARRHIVIPPIEPGARAAPQPESLFPDRSSQVVVTARIPFSEISDLVQRSISPSIGGEFHPGDSGGFSGITVRPSLTRDPVALSPLVGSDPAKVSLATGLHGRVNVSAFKWIIVNLLVGTLKTKSPTVSQDVDVAARIDGWIAPGIDPAWKFSHQEHFDVHVDRAEAKIFGIIPISLKDEVQRGVDGAAPGMIKDALDHLADKLPIRAEMEKVWKELHRPVRLATGPEAYALLKPERIRLQKVAFDDPATYTVRAALDAKVFTQVASDAPKPPQPASLPPLVQERVISPQFRVVVPLFLELSAVNATLRNRQSTIAIKLDQDSSVDLSDLEFYSKDGWLYVKLTVHGTNQKIRAVVDGTVFLECKPAYDKETQQLRVKDVDFEFQTRNWLASFAAWMLNDLICRRVEESLRVDVSKELAKLKDDVNKRYATVEPAPGVRLKSQLVDAVFTGVQVRDDSMVAGFELGGELSCELSVTALR